MKKYFRSLFLLAALSLSITGCTTMETTQFENSPYGAEVQSVINTCMDMQKKGLLPGINAGEDKSMKFESDGIDFTKRNEVAYPLRLNCNVIKHGQRHSFSFVKQSSASKWKLSQ